jgi:hypothetical protein
MKYHIDKHKIVLETLVVGYKTVLEVNVTRLVLAGAVTAITIAGTLYGAGLKTEQQVAHVRISTSSSLSTFDSNG